MKTVRFGIIGLGVSGATHARNIAASRSDDFFLTAVADARTEVAARTAEELKTAAFNDAGQLFDSGLCDAVLICTPHWLHPELTIRAARAGLHVLCEKPLAVTVGEARAMVDECRKHKVSLGVMLQQRTRDAVVKMKRMIDGGRLGEVFHVEMICSDWYRTQAYYDSNPWRGTWDGEGGGVLVNQAVHSLDLLAWVAGLPKKVAAFVDTRYHQIEADDTAAVVCWYGQGRTGSIYVSTAHAPGREELRFHGEKGTLIVSGNKLVFGRLAKPLGRHIHTCKDPTDKVRLEATWRDVATKPASRWEHMRVVRAFAGHVLRGTPMVADGADALNQVELSNAIYLAGYEQRVVDLPVDAGRMDRLLARLEKQRSRGAGGGLRARSAAALKKLLAAPARKKGKR